MESRLRRRREEIHLLEKGGASEDDILAAKAKYHALSDEYAEFSKAFDLPQQRERINIQRSGGVDVSFGKPLEKPEKAVEKSGKSGIIKARKLEPLPPEKVVPTLREDSKEWLEKLTDEETRSIKKYTKNLGDAPNDKFYARLNAMLRGEIPENETLVYYSNQISSAISKYDLKHDIVCYRTLDFNAYNDIEIGKYFKEPQFTSTSVVKSKVLNKPFFVKINIPQKANGAYIETISEFPNQREFLIDKGAVFKVISKLKNSIELEMVL